ncbi:glycoside hydrolase family 6 protein [Streptomyces sp. NPDC001020]
MSDFERTGDEIVYARHVLADLGGPVNLGVVIDTSRNGNGAPADGGWCDPPGRWIGPSPTPAYGGAGIDAYLWVELPGESDGLSRERRGVSAKRAYELAR